MKFTPMCVCMYPSVEALSESRPSLSLHARASVCGAAAEHRKQKHVQMINFHSMVVTFIRESIACRAVGTGPYGSRTVLNP